MAVRTITTKLALDGETEFKKQLQNINAELRLHKSEMERVQAEYAGQLNSLEALQAQEAALGGQLEAVGRKYDEQAVMLEKAQNMQRLYSYEIEKSSGKLERAKAKLDELNQSDNASAAVKKRLTAEIQNHSKALEDAQKNFQKATNTATEYQKSLNYTARDQAKLETEIKLTRKYLNEASVAANKCASSIDGYGNAVKAAGTETKSLGKELQQASGTGNSLTALASGLQAAGVGVAVREMVEVLQGCVDASVKFESALAGVNKVAKLSDEDLAALGADIKQLSTEIPATTGEIAAVAEAAARLGIAQEDLMAFTEVMIHLGNVSNLSADEAATALARFANITGTAAEDYERLGSTIVALGNNFATSEAEISSMASRLAAAGELAGLSEAQIMALAAAMSSVGIDAEAGGTAMTQTLTAIEKAVTEGGEKLEQFAQVAGMSSGEFAQAWQTEPIAAIQAFITGLGGMDEAGESATAVLDELGLSGVRQSNMLKSLGLASETLAEAMTTAEEAWRTNTELAETAAERYDTTEAKMQLAANAANNLKIAVGDALTPALEEMAENGTFILEGITGLLEKCPELTVALTAFFGIFAVGAVGLTAYTTATKAAAVASAALGTSMNLIPGMALVAGIGAIAAALHNLWMRLRDTKEASDDLSGGAEAVEEAAEAEAEAAEENAAAQEGQAKAMEEAAEASETARKAAEEQAKTLKELEKTSKDLSKSVDTLAKALKEQAEDGDLSLKTALDLIDAGYGAALAIDTETGSVTLNRAAYVELATAKINDQIASLEVQRKSEQNRARLEAEAEAAAHAGSAYWEAAVAKAALDKGDTTGIDAQIAALKQARAEVQSFTGAAETAGRASSSRAKKAKTAAETDLASFKELRAELDHQKNMELVSERDYYVRLKEYRDQYLTDEGNLAEYRRVTEQIFKYDKQLADSEAALWAEQTENLVGELETRVKGIESQRSGMEKALSGYGELFSVKDDRMSLESIQEQIDAINRYEEAMTGLRERGLSQDLLDEVLAMNVDEATEYGEQLLAMSDAQWEQYNQLWDEKQLRAAQVAEQFYREQLETLETEYDARLGEALDGLTDTAFRSGEETAKGLIEGLASQEEALYAKARAMEQEVARILEGAWKNIPSNAEIAARLNTEALQMPQPATAQDVRGAVAAVVNGIQTASVGRAREDIVIPLVINGREFARATIQDFRSEERANPPVMDDK